MTEDKRDLDLDDQELAGAHAEGERVPAWLLADDPKPPTEGISEHGRAALHELLQPLDPAMRARILDQSVGQSATPNTANVVAFPARHRRWLWGIVPLVAAASVALMMLARDHETVSGELVGETLLRSAKRGEPRESARTLHLAPRDNLYLDCKPSGEPREVVAVQVSRGPEVLDLEFKLVSSDAGQSVLHILHPDLSPGSWDIRCGVASSAGRVLWIEPPATLVVLE